jgi:membrane-associated protein
MTLLASTLQLPIALGPKWLDPEFLIETFGMIGLLTIVFTESGLLIGILLPGDSLLFTAGLLSANDSLPDLWILLVTIPIAAIAGDQVGYSIGRRTGPAVFKRSEGIFFRREYVERAEQFYERYGGRTIIIARFVPIVRTIAPVMAGVARMRYRTFLTYNIVGGVGWGIVITTLGYFLGQIDFVRENIEFIVIGIVGLSLLPIAIEVLRSRRRARMAGPVEPPPIEGAIEALEAEDARAGVED